VYQAVDAVTQLRGQAEANQIPNEQTALIQSLSGPASTAVSHILQKLDRRYVRFVTRLKNICVAQLPTRCFLASNRKCWNLLFAETN
jgi:hypothetical protein